MAFLFTACEAGNKARLIFHGNMKDEMVGYCELMETQDRGTFQHRPRPLSILKGHFLTWYKVYLRVLNPLI